MSLSQKVLTLIKEKRERVLNGLINCIPLPYSRFRTWWPGIEQAKYYLVSANQKVGKSKFTDRTFVYHPFFYFLNNPQQGDVRVIYFTREMSKEDKMLEFYSYLLYYLSDKKIRISPTDLKSTREDKVLPEEVITILESEEYQKYIKAFEERVIYIDDIGNPVGVDKYCKNFALEHGHYTYTKRKVKNEITNQLEDREFVDGYIPDDPNVYTIVIFDNAANIVEEAGLGKMGSIGKLSKRFVALRDRFKFTIVLIQHQSLAQEGIDNLKMNQMKPTSSGLGDCKGVSRDINTAIGLYSPFKFGIKSYEGYDICKFKNNIRFMEIMEDRDNGAGGYTCPLYFDGATGTFEELPLPNDTAAMARVYDFLDRTRAGTLMLAHTRKSKKSFLSILFKTWVKS